MRYFYCFVPCCKNTSVRTPNKLFIAVPRSEPLRTKWMNAVRRDLLNDPVSVKSDFRICEDHFDLENDIENLRYVQHFKAQGKHVRILLKPGILPTKFDCQIGRQVTAYKNKRIIERRENLSQKRKLGQSHGVKKILASSDEKSVLRKPSCSTEERKQIFPDVLDQQDDPGEDILGKCEELILPVTHDKVSCVQDVIFFVDNGSRKNDFRVENEFEFLEPLQPLDDPFYNCEYSSEEELNKEDPLGDNVPTKIDTSDNEIDRNNDEADEEPEGATDSEKEDDDESTDEAENEDVESDEDDDDKELENTQDVTKEDAESPSDKVINVNEEVERTSNDERPRVEIEKANDHAEEDFIRGRGDLARSWDSDESYEEENYSDGGSNGEERNNSERRSGNVDSESDFDGFEEDEDIEVRLKEEEDDRSSEKDKENHGDNKNEYEEKHTQSGSKLSKHNLNENSIAEEYLYDDSNLNEEGLLKENTKRKRSDSEEYDPVARKKIKLYKKEMKNSWNQRMRAYEEKLHPSLHMTFLDDWGPKHTSVKIKKDEPEDDCDVNILYEELEIDDDDDDDNTVPESNVHEANQLQGSDANSEGGNVKRILTAKDILSSPGQPLKTVLHNGKLKFVVQPPSRNGPSLLKSPSATGERANSVTSILKPMLSKVGTKPGTFIKLSDIQSISSGKVPESPSLKIPVPSGTSLSQNNIKVLQRTPASEAQSGVQKTLQLIPKSLLSPQTNLRGASLLKSSPMLLTTSQSSDSESSQNNILKLSPMTNSPHNIAITSKQDPAKLRCEFCKIVFLKASSLEIHQKARHGDQLKAKAVALELAAKSQYSPTTSQSSGPTTSPSKFITLPTKKIITLPSTKNQQKIVTLPTTSQQKLITVKQIKPVLPNISQHKLVHGTGSSPKGRPLINQNNVYVISKTCSPLQKKPQTDSHADTNPVTLPDLLELERELKDRAGNCDSCLSGKWVVSDLKKHARLHPYGDENCLICKRSILFHKKYMSHLESHAPESVESLSDSDVPEEILSD